MGMFSNWNENLGRPYTLNLGIIFFKVAIYISQLVKGLYLSIMGLETLISFSFAFHGSYRFGKISYESTWIRKHAKFVECVFCFKE